MLEIITAFVLGFWIGVFLDDILTMVKNFSDERKLK